MKKVMVSVLCLVLIGGLLLAGGCSSTKTSGNSGESGNKEDPSIGVFKDSIKIGTTIGVTGTQAAVGTEWVKGIKTYVNYINDQGGINGRKIDLTIYDDAYTPANTVAGVKRLVEQDKVFALVGMMGSAQLAAAAPTIANAKIPVICPNAPVKKFNDPFNQYLFMPFAPGYYQAAYFVKTALAGGAKKFAMLALDSEYGQEGLLGFTDAIKKYGGENVFSTSFPTTDTDFSTSVLKAKDSGADAVLTWGGTPQASLMLKEINKIGWKPKFVMSGTGNADQMVVDNAGAQASEGWMVLSPMLPLDSPTPGMQQYKELLEKYYPGSQPKYFSQFSYTSMKMFVEALKTAGQNPTRESIMKALESMKDFDLGTMGKITFSSTNHLGSNLMSLMTAKNGKLEFTKIVDLAQ